MKGVGPRASLQHFLTKQADQQPDFKRVQVSLGIIVRTPKIEGMLVTRSIPLFQAGLGSESVAPRAL